MTSRIDALILPGDEPIDANTLKKHMLFFNSITLANPHDAAHINDGDIVEHFPNFTIKSASRNQFPRTSDYIEKFDSILHDTKHLQNRGIINLTSKKPPPNLDPGVDHSIWHSAVSDELLVKAAVPDCNMFVNPPLGINGYAHNLVLVQTGYKSKYEIDDIKPPYKIDGITEDWSYFSHLRLGRFLKFLRKAHGQGLVPISNDIVNNSLLHAINKKQFSYIEKYSESPEKIATLAFSFDVFDSNSLHKTLADMTWKDVERLRKITLPGINELRDHIIKSAKHLQQNSNMENLDMYRNMVSSLNSDYKNKKEKVADEWEKLRIASVTKFGGVVGAGGYIELSGLIGTTISSSWVDILFKVLCGGLMGTAAISGELKSLLPARKAVQQHPLYFTEKI